MIKIVAIIIGFVLGFMLGLLEKSERRGYTFTVEDEDGNVVYRR